MSHEIMIEAGKPTAPVIVSISEYKGVRRLDVRHYWTTDEGKLAPSQKGVSISLEYAEELYQAIGQVLLQEGTIDG